VSLQKLKNCARKQHTDLIAGSVPDVPDRARSGLAGGSCFGASPVERCNGDNWTEIELQTCDEMRWKNGIYQNDPEEHRIWVKKVQTDRLQQNRREQNEKQARYNTRGDVDLVVWRQHSNSVQDLDARANVVCSAYAMSRDDRVIDRL